MSKLTKKEDAFTGLEAAIVLIAFVVVAAVFSYVMLGAGFFATQEAQRTVHTGVGQATSNVELVGGVVTLTVDATDAGKLSNITFMLQLAAGGAPVDMKKVTYTVSTDTELTTFTYGNVTSTWYVEGAVQTSNNDMLDKFETVQIDVFSESGAGIKLPTIGPNDRFNIEVVPDIGAALPIGRVAPADFQEGYKYPVY
mgnify:CR=1 FL=1